MGNTCAWPVLRTVDLAEALTLAEKLLAVSFWYRPDGCYLSAWAHDDDVLRRLTQAHPGASVELYGEGHTALPASVSLGVSDLGQTSDALRAWADITRCYVLWHDLKWPAVPELGLDEEYKYAELQVACNSHTIYCDEWTAEHTVFVHARPGHDARAAWLAAQVGARVVGPPEEGW
ncbi:hypothetical protein [Streptomyces sp. IB201691-2A2]|uniref:hypothetical protein n=1 Tax=Streptomyces sp. IB201691-2A2 TaxID=2561920 RepID=UPI00117D0815|nr:hypothetical protein [Streptomyces sp. IB201691-2A2]TRO62493.1 hypothetical protein E4K73_20950 [Streptomyces sp. IB201691-2A2]